MLDQLCDTSKAAQKWVLPFSNDEDVNTTFPEHPALDRLISGHKVALHYIEGSASYHPLLDRISMPQKRNFRSWSGYYSTYLHELTHWTGHPSRLNRIGGSVSLGASRADKQRYYREELVAELTSVLIMSEMGFHSEEMDQHTKYFSGYLSRIDADTRAEVIEYTIREAQKATGLILSVNTTGQKV